MMSASKFKSKSNIFLHRRHNPIIKDIDKLLKEYGKSKSENRKMKCLVYIYMMCKEYFHTKPNGRRGDAVQELMDQVKLVLDSPDFKQGIVAKAGGRHYSNGNKQDLMSHTNKTSTSLSSGYTYEGLLPQKNFIDKMHLSLDSLLGQDKYFGVSAMNNYLQQDFMVNQGKGMAEAETGAMKILKTAPFSQVLDHLHDMWHSPLSLGTGKFNYLNMEKRLDYLITFKNGQLYYHKSDTPADSGIVRGELGRFPYAIDTSERLYVLNEGDIGIKYNHSSILSGAPVICAGEIAIEQGRLKFIDNNSGHYKPGTDNLYDAVMILHYNGVNTRTFQVRDEKTDTDYVTGAALIGNARGGGRLLQ